MEKTENVHFMDYVVDGMRKTAEELEKFQLQVSLGKMEAMDKFHELKKSYSHYTHEVKLKAEKGKDQLKNLQSKFQDLQVQLSLGKAETVEAFEEQKRKILLAIHELQVTIKTNPTFIKSYALLLEALEKLKLKLEILSDKLDPLKEKVSKVYENRKEDLENVILSFKEKINSKTDINSRMEIFQEELATAFSHFKKAFVQS